MFSEIESTFFILSLVFLFFAPLHPIIHLTYAVGKRLENKFLIILTPFLCYGVYKTDGIFALDYLMDDRHASPPYLLWGWILVFTGFTLFYIDLLINKDRPFRQDIKVGLCKYKVFLSFYGFFSGGLIIFDIIAASSLQELYNLLSWTAYFPFIPLIAMPVFYLMKLSLTFLKTSQKQSLQKQALAHLSYIGAVIVNAYVLHLMFLPFFMFILWRT